jgi:hypothetical protein
MFSVLDLISIANNATNDDNKHAKQVWRRFKKHPIYAAELVGLSKYCTDYRINPVMYVDDLKRLLTILPDTRRMRKPEAVRFRKTLGATLQRFIDGDTSMIEEIRPNAVPSEPPSYYRALGHASKQNEIESSGEIPSSSVPSDVINASNGQAADKTSKLDALLASTLCNMQEILSNAQNEIHASSEIASSAPYRLPSAANHKVCSVLLGHWFTFSKY